MLTSGRFPHHPDRRQLCAAGLASLLLPAGADAGGGGPDALRGAAAAELGATGRLRAAINLGNPILACRGERPGAPLGVSVDLAREAAQRLGLALELIEFDAAGKVVEAVKARTVDLAFVAIDPVRGADMDYTAPYVIIEGAYLVRADSPLQRNEEVDRAGTRIVVGRGSAYDLYLTRAIAHASLVRAPTSPAVTDLFLAEHYEVAAGVKQQLEADMRRLAAAGGAAPALRLLPGRFMAIEQAMAVPKGRADAQAWLGDFVEAMKRSGFVAASLAKHRVEGATVAPARAG
ncbi:MAG: transporter substrate-binding domain-containing protein [Pelomonas sp.]|nr:transporter substrate-binding domain-containing protein [Roseateles sp.]